MQCRQKKPMNYSLDNVNIPSFWHKMAYVIFQSFFKIKTVISNLVRTTRFWNNLHQLRRIMVITKLPNTEKSTKGKGKTHKSTNRQNLSKTGKLGKPQWPWLGTDISKEMVGWIRSIFHFNLQLYYWSRPIALTTQFIVFAVTDRNICMYIFSGTPFTFYL